MPVFFTRIQTSLNPSFFFFNDTATTEIYTLSLHDALPICAALRFPSDMDSAHRAGSERTSNGAMRSEEQTSELQSRPHLVCRLLLEKKKTRKSRSFHPTNSDSTAVLSEQSQRSLIDPDSWT